MKPSDISGIFQTMKTSVETVENPFGDYYVLKLKNTDDIRWTPGEHAIFTLPGKQMKGRKFRLFSIASTPNEEYILLGTRVRHPSGTFKNELIRMKQGEPVHMRGPFGWFKVRDETSPIVLFASGVGVTPIRSILKSLEHDESRPIEILYASNSGYLFEDEIEQFVKNNAHMKLHKTMHRQDTEQRLMLLAREYGNAAHYYISGALPVLQSTKKLLRSSEIKRNRIVSDFFLGYRIT